MHRKSAYFLFLAVLGMLVIGIVMLFSTSAFAKDSHGDMYFFVKRQAVWLGVGLVVCAVAAIVDYHFWLRTWWIWFGLALVALAFCFVPHFGMRINGSRRWVSLGPATFQPSEIAKVAVIFFLAAWFASREKECSQFLQGFVIPFAIICSVLLLIVTEVVLGTTALIGATMFVVMFVAGTHPALLGILSLGGLGGILFVATHMSERMGRLAAFMDPERFKDDAGLQQMQALIAWGSGGIEELGLGISLLVVFLFVVIIVCGLLIALHAKDRHGLLLGSGIVSLLGLQAAVNIGVTTSLLPNKGLPLPFISYGGSNLAACMFAIGVLVNIYRQGILEPPPVKRATMNAKVTPRL